MRAPLRALGIAAALGFIALDAAPLPDHISRRLVATPEIQAELDAWVDYLRRAGLELDGEAAKDRLVNAARAVARARRAAQAPLARFCALTGTGQDWGLFAYPERNPRTIIVEGRPADGDWETLYRPFEASDPRLAARLRYRRLRAPINAVGGRDASGPQHRRLVAWVADEVFAARPDLVEVKVYFESRPAAGPGEDPAPAEIHLVAVRAR